LFSVVAKFASQCAGGASEAALNKWLFYCLGGKMDHRNSDGKKLYRPSNGTEGEIFMAKFCEKCKHDNPDKQQYCKILNATLLYKTSEKEYPQEWIYEDDNNIFSGKCTNFEPQGGET
jgi:hypothetical protein